MIGDDNEWTLFARCATGHYDPELFFPDETRGPHGLERPTPSIVRAKNVCFHCPVRKQCWDDARRPVPAYEVRDDTMHHRWTFDYTGIRAGMTGKERRALVRAFGERAFKFSEERLGIQISRWGIFKEAS